MTNDKGKYSQYLTVAGNYFANKGWVHLLLAGGLYILYKMYPQKKENPYNLGLAFQWHVC